MRRGYHADQVDLDAQVHLVQDLSDERVESQVRQDGLHQSPHLGELLGVEGFGDVSGLFGEPRELLDVLVGELVSLGVRVS